MPLACLAASIASSKTSPSIPSTVLPNIWISRRYASQANRGLPDWWASPFTESSLRPTFRTVSIIPGIDTAAPDRTETSSGSSAWPSFFPIFCCSRSTWWSISSTSSGGTDPVARYARQASAVMVKPGGTGRPRLVISARFAPFPPSSSNMVLLPSAKS